MIAALSRSSLLLFCILVTACSPVPPVPVPARAVTPPAASSRPEVKEGVVTFVEGKVTAKNGTGWAPLEMGDRVSQGQTIQTGKASSAEIQFERLFVIHLSENSILDLSLVSLRADRNLTSFELFAGSVTSKVARLAAMDRYQVRTKVAVLSVRGTKFTVTYASQEATRLAVEEGAVAVLPESFSPATLIVRAPTPDLESLAQASTARASGVSPGVAAGEELLITRSAMEARAQAGGRLSDSLITGQGVDQSFDRYSASLSGLPAPVAAGAESRRIFEETANMRILDQLPQPGAPTPSGPQALAPPRILSPAADEVVDINAVDSIVFRWQPVAGAQSYEVSFLTVSGGQEKPVKTWKTTTTSVEFADFGAIDVGAFAWSVRALAGTGESAPGEPSRAAFSVDKVGTLGVPTMNTLEPPKINM